MSINIPNQITLGRLVLALAFFVVLSFYRVEPARGRDWILETSFWLFIVAALSDFLDGWLARRWGQVTTFGRVVDPVVDKVLVVGAFIFLTSGLFVDPVTQRNITGVEPWLAVLVLLRELFVSAVRAFAESSGEDFSASLIGKLKMVVQSATVGISLGVTAWFEDSLAWLRTGSVWATAIITTYSLWAYIRRAPPGLFKLSGPAQPPPPRG